MSSKNSKKNSKKGNSKKNKYEKYFNKSKHCKKKRGYQRLECKLGLGDKKLTFIESTRNRYAPEYHGYSLSMNEKLIKNHDFLPRCKFNQEYYKQNTKLPKRDHVNYRGYKVPKRGYNYISDGKKSPIEDIAIPKAERRPNCWVPKSYDFRYFYGKDLDLDERCLSDTQCKTKWCNGAFGRLKQGKCDIKLKDRKNIENDQPCIKDDQCKSKNCELSALKFFKSGKCKEKVADPKCDQACEKKKYLEKQRLIKKKKEEEKKKTGTRKLGQQCFLNKQCVTGFCWDNWGGMKSGRCGIKGEGKPPIDLSGDGVPVPMTAKEKYAARLKQLRKENKGKIKEFRKQQKGKIKQIDAQLKDVKDYEKEVNQKIKEKEKAEKEKENIKKKKAKEDEKIKKQEKKTKKAKKKKDKKSKLKESNNQSNNSNNEIE
jgi:hypothetical protein